MGIFKQTYKRLVLFVSRHRIFLGFLAYSAFCWSWVLQIDIAALSSTSTAGQAMEAIVLLVAAFLSATIYTKVLKHLLGGLKVGNGWTAPIKLVMWWAATELLVAWGGCIVWYGVGSRFDNILPFTTLSHIAIWTPLGYLSRIVGFYGLSGVFFMILMLGVVRDLRKYFVPTVSIIAIATFYAWGIYKTPSGPVAKAVVVSEHSPNDKLRDSIMPAEGSLVVFPEYAFNGLDDDVLISNARLRTSNPVAYFFIGSRLDFGPDEITNQLVAVDTSKDFVHKIKKSRFIPGGEYLPYAAIALLKAVKANDVIDNFQASRAVSVAKEVPKQMLLEYNDFKIGAGICSSIIAPEDYRLLAKNGANIFTNSAALEIFNRAKIYSWQHKSMARFMAIANARTFLQSANSGPSFGFDVNGKQLFFRDTTGTTELSVSLNKRRTIYSLYGEYLSVGGFAWMLLDFVKSIKKSKVLK